MQSLNQIERITSMGPEPRSGASRAIRDLGRTDVGKHLSGVGSVKNEGRGTPAKEATAAFQLLAEKGFNLGKDKNLNRIMASAWDAFLGGNKVESEIKHSVECEKILEFCKLIPDNAIFLDNYVIAIEYTWRKGDFLASKNRSTVAQYILTKLQNYARELGWSLD